MVGTDISVKAHLVKRLHDLVQIQTAVCGEMRRLLKLSGSGELDVAHMGEVDAALCAELPYHSGDIIAGIGTHGAGAHGQTIAGAVHQREDPPHVFCIVADPRQTEDTALRATMNIYFIVVLSATFNRVSRSIFFPIAENNHALFSLYCHLTWMILFFSISSAFPP